MVDSQANEGDDDSNANEEAGLGETNLDANDKPTTTTSF